MRFVYIVSVLAAAVSAAPATSEVNNALSPQACLPASCQSFGCCSGNCDYWCRACGISYVC